MKNAKSAEEPAPTNGAAGESLSTSDWDFRAEDRATVKKRQTVCFEVGRHKGCAHSHHPYGGLIEFRSKYVFRKFDPERPSADKGGVFEQQIFCVDCGTSFSLQAARFAEKISDYFP